MLAGCGQKAVSLHEGSRRHPSAALVEWKRMNEERNDFVVGLVLFLLAMGIITAVLTYAIATPT